jgi:hypothetical protein
LRPFLLTYFLIVLLKPSLAQETIPEFGKVTMDELTMKECAFEKSADAMNLIRQLKISFKYNEFTYVSSNKMECPVNIL